MLEETALAREVISLEVKLCRLVLSQQILVEDPCRPLLEENSM